MRAGAWSSCAAGLSSSLDCRAEVFRSPRRLSGKYMIRAELPGVDPEKDVEVTVDSGMLTIHADRREETKQDRRSEFKYGSLTRSVTLPEGADPDKITASYENGILKITIPVPEEAKPAAHRIAIGHAS